MCIVIFVFIGVFKKSWSKCISRSVITTHIGALSYSAATSLAIRSIPAICYSLLQGPSFSSPCLSAIPTMLIHNSTAVAVLATSQLSARLLHPRDRAGCTDNAWLRFLWLIFRNSPSERSPSRKKKNDQVRTEAVAANVNHYQSLVDLPLTVQNGLVALKYDDLNEGKWPGLTIRLC